MCVCFVTLHNIQKGACTCLGTCLQKSPHQKILGKSPFLVEADGWRVGAGDRGHLLPSLWAMAFHAHAAMLQELRGQESQEVSSLGGIHLCLLDIPAPVALGFWTTCTFFWSLKLGGEGSTSPFQGEFKGEMGVLLREGERLKSKTQVSSFQEPQ